MSSHYLYIGRNRFGDLVASDAVEGLEAYISVPVTDVTAADSRTGKLVLVPYSQVPVVLSGLSKFMTVEKRKHSELSGD